MRHREVQGWDDTGWGTGLHWRPHSCKHLTNGQLKKCTPGSWTKLALGVTRKTNEQKNNRIALKKTTYIVISDATWNIRPMKKQKGVEVC